jgi:hypothetical protein
MADFRTFERDTLRLLAGEELSAEVLDRIFAADVPLKYEYTGCGYFLTLSHPDLPAERAVLSHPIVSALFGSTMVSFLAFLGEHELTLECCSFGSDEIPPNFRDQLIEVFAEQPRP